MYISLVNKLGVEGGVSTIYDKNKLPIKSKNMEKMFESIYLDDTQFYHDVSSITSLDNSEESYRDVLVLTYKKIDKNISH